MTAGIRVLVVDDSDVFRNACCSVVAATAGFELAGTAGSGEEAVRKAVELEPDLVLMDVRMPGIGGVEAARQIQELLPDTTLVMLTADSGSAVAPIAHADLAVVSKRLLAPAMLTDAWRRHGKRA
jgi:DNA-binding NarL/FixJ family response regulator